MKDDNNLIKDRKELHDNAVSFANWINIKRYVGMNSRWYTSHIADTLVASSTEELYKLYLKTL